MFSKRTGKIPPIRGVCWNIAGPNWMGFSKRSAVARRALETLDFDLIFFQEFGVNPKDPSDNNWRDIGSQHPDIEIFLGKLHRDIYVHPIGFNKKRFKLLRSGTFWHSWDGNCRRAWGSITERATSWALLQDLHPAAQSRSLLCINTQLDNVSARSRLKATVLNLALANQKRFQDIPVIFAGDMNISPSNPFRMFLNPVNSVREVRTSLDPDMVQPIQLIRHSGFEDSFEVMAKKRIPSLALLGQPWDRSGGKKGKEGVPRGQ